MRYISIFTGLGSDALAFSSLGWIPVNFFENGEFQSAVLDYHFPGVQNWGDANFIIWEAFRGRADLVIGGPPCPAFSTAGKRGSLGDKRGSLLMNFAEAIDGIGPTWTILENVEGLLNTGDNAFGQFLSRFVGADAPLVPPGGTKWPCSGMVAGPKRAACWRVLSAEHYGLPQRRRRLFMVGHSRDWTCAAKVLLEPYGFGWSSPDRGEDWVKAASRTGQCLRRGSWNIRPNETLGVGRYIYDRFNNTVSSVAPAIGTNCGLQTGRTILIDNKPESMSARRLTPEEIERLQGFKAGWTKIPWRGKPAELCPDRPRYVSLGNAFPAPMISWIAKRIQMVEDGLRAG